MRELALHIMDIIENSIGAGATLVKLEVKEDGGANRLEITIQDNGRGIPADLLKEVTNPFYTTRTTRRVGLGLSLFKEAARRCNGDFEIHSTEREGTDVRAWFQRDHIDLAPMGDMGGSLASLIAGNPGTDFEYLHEVDGRVFRLDTRDVKKELEEVPIHHPPVIRYLAELIREGLADIKEE